MTEESSSSRDFTFSEGAAEVGASGMEDKPVVLLVIGMAGSGKTTLMGRIQTHLDEKGSHGYLINLDPAVMNLPYEPHVDIRDTVRLPVCLGFLVRLHHWPCTMNAGEL